MQICIRRRSALLPTQGQSAISDQHTILVFNEFIMNESWEDEYKALNEFCEVNQYSCEVLAISFLTK